MVKCWCISTVIDTLSLKSFFKLIYFSHRSHGYRCIFHLNSCFKVSYPLSPLRSPLSARILTFPRFGVLNLSSFLP